MAAANPDLPRSAAGPNSPWLLAVIVSIATFMEVLDTTIANVALRHIAGSLAASQDESTYVITSYLVSNAIVLPISGWLSNVIGRKRFYMICVGLFTISSVACAFATSLPMMLLFRVLQGVGGGGLAPTEQSIFADSFTPKQRALAFSLYGFTIVTAPAIGPVLGGWLTDSFSWHWVFLINLPVGALSLILTWLFVYDSPLVQQERATGRRVLVHPDRSAEHCLRRVARDPGGVGAGARSAGDEPAAAEGAGVQYQLRDHVPVRLYYCEYHAVAAAVDAGAAGL